MCAIISVYLDLFLFCPSLCQLCTTPSSVAFCNSCNYFWTHFFKPLWALQDCQLTSWLAQCWLTNYLTDLLMARWFNHKSAFWTQTWGSCCCQTETCIYSLEEALVWIHIYSSVKQKHTSTQGPEIEIDWPWPINKAVEPDLINKKGLTSACRSSLYPSMPPPPSTKASNLRKCLSEFFYFLSARVNR